jgi:hypothetical protein
MILRNIIEYANGEFQEIELIKINEVVIELLNDLESEEDFVTVIAKRFEVLDKPGYFVKVSVARNEEDL